MLTLGLQRKSPSECLLCKVLSLFYSYDTSAIRGFEHQDVHFSVFEKIQLKKPSFVPATASLAVSLSKATPDTGDSWTKTDCAVLSSTLHDWLHLNSLLKESVFFIHIVI